MAAEPRTGTSSGQGASEAGFTLIEVLVSLALCAVIALLLVQTLQTTGLTSRTTRRLAAQEEVQLVRDHLRRALDVAPGYIETDLNRDDLAKEKVRAWLARRVPVGRPGRPEEVARLVGILLSERIGFLTGETIYLDGGQAIHH